MISVRETEAEQVREANPPATMKNVGFGTNCNSPWAKTFDFTGFPQTRTIDSTRRSGRLIRVESLASHAKWCLADIEQHLARESFEQPKDSQTIFGHSQRHVGIMSAL